MYRRLESFGTWRKRAMRRGALVAVAQGTIIIIAPSAGMALEMFTQLNHRVHRGGYPLLMWIADKNACHIYLR